MAITIEACYRDNLHPIWAGQELYRKGNSRETFYHILEKNMMPVYDSARRQGYEIWNYQGELINKKYWLKRQEVKWQCFS